MVEQTVSFMTKTGKEKKRMVMGMPTRLEDLPLDPISLSFHQDGDQAYNTWNTEKH
jgi:hypothetical protein